MLNQRYRAFSISAAEGSFTRAAEIMHYSPSAVSQLVSALEKTEEETAAQYLRQYLDVCAEQGSPLDPAALHTYIDHWLLKGLYVSLSYGNPERTIRRTMDIYDQFIRLFKAL